MNFLKLSTMQYPIQEGDIRLEYPEITDDQTGAAFPLPSGYVEVEQTPMPVFNELTQYLTQSAPVQVGQTWQSVWVVNDMTAEQLAARAEANKPLNHKKRPPTTNNGSVPNVIT